MLSSHLRLGLSSGVFPSGIPTKTLYTPLLSPIRATCLTHLILLDLIILTISGEEYRSLSSSLCSFLLFHEHLQYSGSMVKLPTHRVSWIILHLNLWLPQGQLCHYVIFLAFFPCVLFIVCVSLFFLSFRASSYYFSFFSFFFFIFFILSTWFSSVLSHLFPFFLVFAFSSLSALTVYIY